MEEAKTCKPCNRNKKYYKHFSIYLLHACNGIESFLESHHIRDHFILEIRSTHKIIAELTPK